ncbi:MAG: hypothetical protein J0I23_06655 [Rhizobiales bacterium]|nr:hypothetical protein [Hyphomicrobiales bacterium]
MFGFGNFRQDEAGFGIENCVKWRDKRHLICIVGDASRPMKSKRRRMNAAS